MHINTILYGHPPSQLITPPPSAVQCSPLIINAASLDEWAEGTASGAIIHAPPGTVERRYVLAQTLRALKPGATLMACAANDKGGKRIAQELTGFGCTVHTHARDHHQVCTATRPEQLQTIERVLAEGTIQRHPTHGLWTQPGIFSWDRIDPASALLIAHLPPLNGHGLDLGCGMGVLSLAVLANTHVASLTLIDLDRRAIACAQKNSADSRAAFLWADVCDELPALPKQDFVVMNPPFHAGGTEEKSLGQRFIAQAAMLLKPGGQCWLVANRHLPYEAMLRRAFRTTHSVYEDAAYKIYHAEK